ncbi:hypothetical protein [Sporichthya brevicatena]|uniref:hypothetical protein n=1 Tax=Sporichthya brevicatena TaxID=171442 RepID=UPI0031D64373
MDSDSTLADVHPPELRRRARAGRRAVLVVLALVVLAGATTLLGVRTGTASTTDGTWSLQGRYPQIARSGLDVVWQVRVTHPGGFREPIRIAVNGSFFDIFETQGFHPEPSKTTRDDRWLYLEFDPPPGDEFLVDYDAYIQGSSQLGRRGEVRLMDGERPRLSVTYRTWLAP